MEKEEGSRKCKRSCGGVQRKNECRSKKVRKLDMVEKRDFRRGKLLGKYTVKMLYGWNDGKFEEEYLRKLERNFEGGIMLEWKTVNVNYFSFSFLSLFSFPLFSILRT